MEASELIAKVLAAIYLSVGVGFIFNGKYYSEAIGKLLDNNAYLFLGGWVATSVGVVMVYFHNIWVNDWRVLVTVVAWVVLTKGVLLLAFPSFVKVFEAWFTRKAIRNYIMPMVFILGFIFLYYGFFTS